MDNLTMIIALCTMLWYVIDRLKKMWSDLPYGKYITMCIAAVGSFAMVFSFDLDMLFALNIIQHVTVAGKVLTGLMFMGGSSALSEAIEMYRGNPKR